MSKYKFKAGQPVIYKGTRVTIDRRKKIAGGNPCLKEKGIEDPHGNYYKIPIKSPYGYEYVHESELTEIRN